MGGVVGGGWWLVGLSSWSVFQFIGFNFYGLSENYGVSARSPKDGRLALETQRLNLSMARFIPGSPVMA